MASNMLSWLNDRYMILSNALYCIPDSVADTPTITKITTVNNAIKNEVATIRQSMAWDNTHASILPIMDLYKVFMTSSALVSTFLFKRTGFLLIIPSSLHHW